MRKKIILTALMLLFGNLCFSAPTCQSVAINRWYGYVHRLSADEKTLSCPDIDILGYVVIERHVPRCGLLSGPVGCVDDHIVFRRVAISPYTRVLFCTPHGCIPYPWQKLENEKRKLIVDIYRYSDNGRYVYVPDKIYVLDGLDWPF